MRDSRHFRGRGNAGTISAQEGRGPLNIDKSNTCRVFRGKPGKTSRESLLYVALGGVTRSLGAVHACRSMAVTREMYTQVFRFPSFPRRRARRGLRVRADREEHASTPRLVSLGTVRPDPGPARPGPARSSPERRGGGFRGGLGHRFKKNTPFFPPATVGCLAGAGEPLKGAVSCIFNSVSWAAHSSTVLPAGRGQTRLWGCQTARTAGPGPGPR